jgi:glycine cleavage system H protein
MLELRDDLKYSKEHEWVKVEGNLARVGITAYAQDSLGDIVFVELPEVDREVAANDNIGVVESVKAVSDIYVPVSGKIVEVNDELNDSPEIINESPYDAGWICVIELKDVNELDDLLTAEEYQAFTESED